MDAAEVLEARPVAEPAAHLHEGVVHLRVAVHVADGQPLDGQASGEAQTTDRDRGQPDSFLRVAGVVAHLVPLAVDYIERSEESRFGKGGVGTGRFRWSR